MKTILVHIQNDERLDQRLQSGLSVARACAAHMTCLHVTPIEAYQAIDTLGGVTMMVDVTTAIEADQTQLRADIEARLRGEDVSWDWQESIANVAGAIVGGAALADLVVIGREASASRVGGAPIGLIADVLGRCRTPVLIPGDGAAPCDPCGAALIAWDGSYEAANAVRGAVPLLKLAAEVRVIRFDEDKDETFPNTRLLEFLSRHGIHAELRQEDVAGADVAQRMIAAAQDANAYLVMGAYSHSRIGEFLFGGVTRSLLSEAPVPIVLAH